MGINKICGKAFNVIANSNYIKKNLATGLADPAKFGATMMVTSIVSKDLVGCALYTGQSLTNKKIPKENRLFVGMIDLVNGILMVGGQLLVGKVIDKKIIPQLQDKSTAKYFSEDTFRKAASNAFEASKKSIGNVDDKTKEKVIKNVVKGLEKTRKNPYLSGLSIVTAALLTTALVKRTIVPLISTPVAGKLSESIEKRGAKKAEAQKAEATK